MAPPPAPEPEPARTPEPDDTASVSAPPPIAADEPDLPWFGHPAPPQPTTEPAAVPQVPAEAAEPDVPLTSAPIAQDEPPQEAHGADDDLFERHDPPHLHAPTPREDDRGEFRSADDRLDHEAAPRTDHVPEWAWPSALDSRVEPAPARAVDLDARPEPVTPEPVRVPPRDPPPAAPTAAKPLDPDATRTLGNIRRLMLASNLFMVVAIGAVLTVVGYRLYRAEPAPPLPPAAAPAPAKIPLDMALTLPRGARIVQTAVAGDRLVITLEIDGATEIRTFDVKTLQPTGRMSFATVP